MESSGSPGSIYKEKDNNKIKERLLKLRSAMFKLNLMATTEMKAKALALRLSDSVLQIEEDDNKISFKIFIEGYQKSMNIVIIEFLEGDVRVKCLKNGRVCDSFNRHGVCSHVLAAIYFKLKTTGHKKLAYDELKKKAIDWMNKFKRFKT